MRHRYMDLFGSPDGRVDGQKFLNMNGRIFPADMASLKRVRDNELPNTPHQGVERRDIALMPNSRQRGI